MGLLGSLIFGPVKLVGKVAVGTAKVAGTVAVGTAKVAGTVAVGTAKVAGKVAVAGAKTLVETVVDANNVRKSTGGMSDEELRRGVLDKSNSAATRAGYAQALKDRHGN